MPSSLKATTDIVGYPIFADFNFVRYFDAYYAIAFVFPALVILLYHLFAWRGPLRKPRETRPVRPVVISVAEDEPEQRPSTHPSGVAALRYLGAAARLLLPAVAVALEISSRRPPHASVPTPAGVVAGIIYLGAVTGGSALVTKVGPPGTIAGPDARTAWVARARAIVRTGAALSVVPLLYIVSRSTSVTVQADRRIVHYPWLPGWLVLGVSAGLALWLARRIARSRSDTDFRSAESAVFVFVVGPVLLFLSVAMLPGASGSFAGFDDGQGLAAAQLAFHGLFPWKDLFFIHGILTDVLDDGIGMAAFSNSRWGGSAGVSMFVVPATILVFYYFTSYFARRNRLLVVGVSAAMVLGLLGGFANRFAFAPILLVLLDVMLRRPKRLWCGVFVATLVVEVILTPEIGLLAIGLLATLVVFEWFGRTPGTAVVPAFFRTLWCLGFGLGFTVAWLAFLAASGALAGFIDYFLIFAPGHAISGAIPTQWSLLHNPAVTIEFFLPVILIVLTLWRAVAKLRGRRTWTTRDWTMVAAASWVVLYYGKALGRADAAHVSEAFTVAIPLLLLWVIEVLAVSDRFVSQLRSSLRVVRVAIPRRLCTAAALLAVVAVAPQPILTLRQTAVRFGAVAPTEPVVPRLGYSLAGAIDATKLEDLKTVLDRYAGVSGPVFDFTNDPGIIYYLLGRVPASRFYHVSMAIPPYAQSLLVSDLERSRPRIVVFNDVDHGLPEWDGVLNTVRHYAVSQYLLDHYVPLVDADGTRILIRSDLAPHAPPPPPLVGPMLTSNLYFDAPTCAWGDIPNFLRVTGEPTARTAIRISAHVVGNRVTSVTGWAVDHSILRPAKQVIAVSRGRVVATAEPAAPRPDVVQSLKSSGVLASGFTLGVPSQELPIQLYSLNDDGTLTPLTLGKGAPSSLIAAPGTAPSVMTTDYVVRRVAPAQARGMVDSASATPGQIESLVVPPGTELASYRWLELRSPRLLSSGHVTVTDALGDASHEITFNVLPASHSHVAVQVGSCQQWHGYQWQTLFLVRSGAGPAPTVWLSR